MQSCSKCKFFNSCYWQEQQYNSFEGQEYEENDCGHFVVSPCKGTGQLSKEAIEKAERERIFKELKTLSFTHRTLGKQRIDNFIKALSKEEDRALKSEPKSSI